MAEMKVKGTYFQNSKTQPLVYGDVNLINPKRRRLRDSEEKEGILAETVIAGFCGTDNELLHMSREGKMNAKFPPGETRLINGHEGVVWVPEENRFAIVLIRGGNSYDPTRYEDGETYFEYGCDGADGLMSQHNFYNPEMLLEIPEEYLSGDKIPLSLAKKLTFSDPYACMLFQYERTMDLGVAHLFRLVMRKHDCNEEKARELAREETFKRVVIFGLGTTGLLLGDVIRKNHPDATIVFVARSAPDSQKAKFAVEGTQSNYVQSNFDTNEELAEAIVAALGGKATVFVGASGASIEHKIAFDYGVLSNNGLYNSFSLGPELSIDTMPFGFKNHLIFGSINFRQDHMEEAIRILAESNFDELVEILDFDEFIKDPVDTYDNRIYAKNSPMKTAVIWNETYIDFE